MFANQVLRLPRKCSRLMCLSAWAITLIACSRANAQVYGPDLYVQSITPSVANPTIGQHFNTTITVRNNGNLDAGPFYLLLHSDRASEPTTPCGDYETFAYFNYGLAAGQSSSITVETWYETGGSHTFWAWVDGCNSVGELNENNNKTSRTFQIAQPDLIVQSITPSVATPTLGVPFTMSVTLRNQGAVAAGPFYLLIDRDRTSAPNLECAGELSEYIPGLAANATVTKQYSVTYTTGGAHTFWARVDGCGDVTESNENNNRSSRTSQVPAPDLVVHSISSPPSFIFLNSNHAMSAVIKNNGTVASNPCVVHVYKNSALEPMVACSGELSISVPAIAPGQTHPISFSVNYNTTGNKNLWLWADSCLNVSELSETNNKRSVTMPVRRGPNLVVDSITPTDSPVRQLNSTSVDVVIRNAGDAPTPSNKAIKVNAFFNLSSEPNNPCTSPDRVFFSDPLAAGQSRTLHFTGVTYWLPGLHRFWAIVDPCDDIRESSGSDNARSKSIDVHLPM